MSKLRDFLVKVVGIDKPNPTFEADAEPFDGVKRSDDQADDGVFDAVGDRAKEFVCKIFLENNTDVDLKRELDGVLPPTAKFEKVPPPKIPAGKTGDCTIRSTTSFSGFSNYLPEDTLKEKIWASDFEFVPTQDGAPEKVKLETTSRDERFIADKKRNGLEFRFILNQKPVPPQPQQGFESRIVIENNTGITLTKGPESIEGTVVKAPPDRILAEESAPVIIQSKKNPDDGTDFVSFATVWKTGAGNWTISFNHISNQPKGQASKS